MSYGIKITGNDGTNDFTVLDTGESSIVDQVVATGSGTSVNVDLAAYGGSGGTKTLYFRPKGSVTVAKKSGSTYSFYRLTITEDGNAKVIEVSETAVSCSWVLVRDLATSPINSSMGTYGFQVFNSDGSIMVDSKRINANESFRLKGIASVRSIGGDYLTTSATIATNADDYYVNATGTYSSNTSTGGDFHGYALVGSVGSQILRHSQVNWSEGTGGSGRAGSNITRYLPNFKPIKFGELR